MVPVVEIVIIAIMINYLLSFLWNTRSIDLVFGLLAFIVIFAVSSFLHLPVLRQIVIYLGNVAVFAIIVIFQPELRVALSKLSWKGKRLREITEFDKFLDQLANSTYRMADKRIGALIVLENEESLDEYANKGVLLGAEFSSELVESLFAPSTPLHDGAVIIRDHVVVAAAVILPLSEDTTQITRAMGTRHRAGLGASQKSDALIIVISEETGRVSIARDGIMTRGVKIDRFKGIIRSIYSRPDGEGTGKKKHSLKEWVKQKGWVKK